MMSKFYNCLVKAKKRGVKNLVLGASGCGAFHNDPKLVAQLWKRVLLFDEFQDAFAHISFAIFNPTQKATIDSTEAVKETADNNYKIFREVFNLK